MLDHIKMLTDNPEIIKRLAEHPAILKRNIIEEEPQNMNILKSTKNIMGK